MTKLPLIAAAVAAIGSSAAFADDPQLQARLQTQRVQWPTTERSTTIAVYAGHHGVTQRQMEQNNATADVRFELRDNGHGQLRGVYTTGE